MGYIHPAVSEICDPQSLDPICDKFDKFLAHGQAHMGQMGEWPWPCTTRGLDNSTELRMEKIHQAVTEICIPQIWQPPAHPPGPWRQYPSSPEGWGVKRCDRWVDRQTDGRTDGTIHRAAWSQLKMASGITKMQKSLIGSICKYLMSYNAGLRKRLRSCPNEYASQLWHQLKKYFSIHHINGAFLMNVSRKHVKRSLKIEFCDNLKTHDLC